MALVALGLVWPAPAAATTCSSLAFSPAGTQVRPGTSLPTGTVGVTYQSVTITVSGPPPANANGQYYWQLAGGSLPPGLTWTTQSSSSADLNDQVVISGTPTNGGNGAGPYDFNFVVYYDIANCAGTGAWWNITTGYGPQNTSPPTISGTAAPGNQLTCNTGSWTADPNYTNQYAYQWFENDQPTSITTQQYNVQGSDAGQALSCHVTASNPFGSASAPSGPVSVSCSPSGAAHDFSGFAFDAGDSACASLEVTQTADPDPVGEGTSVGFAVAVTNVGNATASHVQLVDALPGNARLIVASFKASQGTCPPPVPGASTVSCSLGDLPPGGKATLTFAVDAPPQPDALSNYVDATSADSPAASSSISVRVVAPVLTLQLATRGWRGVPNINQDVEGGEESAAKPQGEFAPGEALEVIATVSNSGGDLEDGDLELVDANGKVLGKSEFEVARGHATSVVLEARLASDVSLPLKVIATHLSDLPISREVPIRLVDPYDALGPAVVLQNGGVEIEGGVGSEPLPPIDAHIDAPALPPSEVIIAVQRPKLEVARAHPASCLWLAGGSGRFKRRPATRGACDTPIWLRATGIRHWSLHVRGRLQRGRYVLYIRVIDKAGVYDPIFSAHHHNRLAFRVR